MHSYQTYNYAVLEIDVIIFEVCRYYLLHNYYLKRNSAYGVLWKCYSSLIMKLLMKAHLQNSKMIFIYVCTRTEQYYDNDLISNYTNTFSSPIYNTV